MLLDEFAFLQFRAKLSDPLIESQLVISTFFDAVVVMDVDSAFILDDIAFIGSFLRVIPFRPETVYP